MTNFYLALLVAFMAGAGFTLIALAVLAVRLQRPPVEKPRLSAVEQRDLVLLQSIHPAPKERQ